MNWEESDDGQASLCEEFFAPPFASHPSLGESGARTRNEATRPYAKPQLRSARRLCAMSLYSPLHVEKDEATPKTDLGKSFNQLQHKKFFQEVVASARVAERLAESCFR